MSVKAGSIVWMLAAAAAAGGQAAEPAGVAAKVGQREILAEEVARVVTTAAGANQTNPDALAFLQAQALEQLVQRELVSAHLDRLKFVLSKDELELAYKTVEAQLAAEAGGLEKALAKRNLTLEKFREQVAFEARWNKYTRDNISDKDLEAWFQAHRRDYDGTELRCRHVLFRGPNVRDPAAVPAVVAQADAVRRDILDGKLSFEEAASKYSAGPSRQQGGDLGFIPRRERMVEAFSAALFALEKGQISPPVVTFFGVHLIQCTDVKPGTKTWQDARPELTQAVVQDLFARLAADERRQTPVEYTGATPYLDPQSGQIVPARRDAP